VLLLPTERLSVALCPQQIGIELGGATWRRKASLQTTINATPSIEGVPIWQNAINFLASWLKEQQLRRATMSLVLSNRFVRFTLMPWSSAVSTASEEAELALAAFESRYGDMTGWAIQLDSASYGKTRIACAVDMALIDSVRRLCTLQNIACHAIQPAFVAGWNHLQHEMKQSRANKGGIFAMAESNTLVMAIHNAGTWHSLRSISVHADRNLLPSLIERETLLQGFAKSPPAWLSIPGEINRDLETNNNKHKQLHIIGIDDTHEVATTLARWGKHW
jgi:hypothetical protein